MKEYNVRVPLMGAMSFIVEADSEPGALEKIWEMDFRLEVKKDNAGDEIYLDEYEIFTTPINRGNVFYGPCGEPDVEETN